MTKCSCSSPIWDGVITRTFLLLPFLFTISACAVPNYSTAVKKFSDATADTKIALTSLNETVTREYELFLKDRALAASGSTLERVDKECRTAGTRCRLELLSSDPQANRAKFPPEPILNNLITLMGHISAYAQDLNALATDESAAEVQSSVNAAIGNIQNLANTLASMQSKDESVTVSEFATPVASAFYWVIGRYSDNVKLRGLRDATDKADRVIQEAARQFSNAGAMAERVAETRISEILSAELQLLTDQGLTEPGIDRAVGAAKKFDDILRSRPDAVFKKMAIAHRALNSSLNERDVSLSQMFANVEEFAKSAEELATIAKSLAEMGTK